MIDNPRSSILFNIKKEIQASECLRIFLLIVLVVYAYGAFLFGVDIGSGDAHWYQYILHDALIQLDQGRFPVYVGQSEFNAFGTEGIRAPYYLLLGQLLHVLSFGQLNALYIQHFSVFVSALAAAFIAYYLFSRLVPQLRWAALLFAFFYISCPAVIGLIARCDMYYSFMTVPYIPIVIFGLIRTYQTKDQFFYCVITAAALAIVWMAHPPIALWLTAVCLLFYVLRLIFLRTGLRGLLLILLLSTVLALWQFVAVYTLALGSQYGDYPANYVTKVVTVLRSSIPGVFLPLGWNEKGAAPFLQLGYSLWLVFFVSTIVAFRVTSQLLLRLLLISTLGLLLLVYPLTGIGELLWSLTPKIVRVITYLWAMQRIDIILAALLCVIGILILNILYTAASSFLKNLIVVSLIILGIWNIYQTSYFIKFINLEKKVDQTWIDPHALFFFLIHRQPAHSGWFEGNYDPRLKNRLLDSRGSPIAGYDNEQVLLQRCFLAKSAENAKIHQNQVALKLPIRHDFTVNHALSAFPLLKLKAYPSKNYLLCLKINAASVAPTVEIVGTRFLALYNAPVAGTQTIAIPIYVESASAQELSVQLQRKNSGVITVGDYGFINYDTYKLPIRVEAFTPFKAVVNNPLVNSYLEVFKEYYPGYQAKVNGNTVPVTVSKDQLILIPLMHKGINQVELVYVGTPLMQVAYYISFSAWLLLFIYLFSIGIRRFFT